MKNLVSYKISIVAGKNLRIRKFSSRAAMTAFFILTVFHVSTELEPVVINDLTIQLHLVQHAFITCRHLDFQSFSTLQCYLF